VNAWEGLSEEVDALVARLRPIGKTIGAEAAAGDPLAQKVVNNYSMLHRRVDPMAYIITKDALDAWERARNVACSSPEAKA
jgi:hypothetical protein